MENPESINKAAPAPDPRDANRTPLENLAEDETRSLQVALTVNRRANGCNTPAETLIDELLNAYDRNGRLDPADVDEAVANFKGDLEYAVQEAARVTNQYPDLVAAVAVAA